MLSYLHEINEIYRLSFRWSCLLWIGFALSSPVLGWEALQSDQKPLDPVTRAKWSQALLLKLQNTALVDQDLGEIQSRLKEAESSFLRLEFERAWGISQEVLMELESRWPSQNLLPLWQKSFALAIASGHEINSLDKDFLAKARPLSALPIFNSILSKTLKEKYFSNTQPAKFSPSGAGELIFLYGTASNLIELRDGDFFIQRLSSQSFDLKSHWSSSPSAKVRQQKSLRVLEQLFKETRPTSTLYENIKIEIPSGPSFQLKQTRFVRKEPSRSREAPISHFQDQEDLTEIINAAEEKKDFKLLKSPWFWAIAGGVAIGSGFLAYELSKPDKVKVRLP